MGFVSAFLPPNEMVSADCQQPTSTRPRATNSLRTEKPPSSWLRVRDSPAGSENGVEPAAGLLEAEPQEPEPAFMVYGVPEDQSQGTR